MNLNVPDAFRLTHQSSMISTILLVFAFVLFVLAGLRVGEGSNPPRFSLLAFGLACWVLSVLLAGKF